MNKRAITIVHCARCGENHSGVEFSRFTEPLVVEWDNRDRDIGGTETYEWWGMCPKLHEPIVMKVIGVGD